jgi:hypothetical protein
MFKDQRHSASLPESPVLLKPAHYLPQPLRTTPFSFSYAAAIVLYCTLYLRLSNSLMHLAYPCDVCILLYSCLLRQSPRVHQFSAQKLPSSIFPISHSFRPHLTFLDLQYLIPTRITGTVGFLHQLTPLRKLMFSRSFLFRSCLPVHHSRNSIAN